jgi:acetyl esterase/lipase
MTYKQRIGLVLALVGAWSAGQARGAEAAKTFTVRAIKDVTYYDGPGQHKVKHKLDLFLPQGGKDFPVLLFVHGGAWLHGDKNFFGFYSALGRALARHGIGVAVTNYRLSPAVKHPEHVRDVARAFAWTYKNIARYGGRRDRLFVCGHSAGGHLVSLLATDKQYLEAVGLTSKAIRGVIPISGIYAIPVRGLTAVFGADPEARRQASPIRHVRKDLPPFLILFADKDFVACGRKPSEAFCKALKDKGAKARTLEITGSNHFDIIIKAAFPDSPVGKAVLGFIRRHSGK